MTQQDYYEVLEVEPSADAKAVREAYRNLALKYHPDRNQDNPQATEQMKRVNEAYAVLSDPQKRSEFDAMRRQYGPSAHGHFRQTYTEQDIFQGTDIHSVFEEMARSCGMRGFDEVFHEFYGQNFRTFKSSGPGYRSRGFVFTGGGGPGRRGGRGRRGKGMGWVARKLMEKATGMAIPQAGVDLTDAVWLRPDQALKGGPHAYEHRKSGRKLIVKIPPGIGDGKKVRLAGMGAAGRNGGPAGDLYLEVRIRRSLLGRIQEAAGRLLKR